MSGRTDAHDSRAWVYSEVDQRRLAAPVERGHPVPRPALVEQLVNRSAIRIVSIAAPAGYGKTTLLCQWLSVERRPVVWITCGWADADPVVFLRTLAVALDRDESLPDEVFGALDYRLSAPIGALHRLRAALAGRTTPLLLVFDDAHCLSSAAVIPSVRELATAMPDDCTLVLAGRVALDIPMARLRMEDRLIEFGPSDLALSREQSQAMLLDMGVRLDRPDMNQLYERTEGWTAGLKLAALGISGGAGPESGPAAPNAALRPGDRYLAEYVTEEVLSFVDPALMPFLRESSIFERMSGPLCDSVLGRDDSAAALEHLAHTRSFFVVALDAERHWYQYHHLFAELLREELQRSNPGRFETLNQRASDWFDERGDPDAAVRHAVAAGDRDRAGDLILTHAMPLTSQGRDATVGMWLAAIDERWIREVPALAFAGALYGASAADIGAVERYLAAARRLPDSGPLADGTPSLTVGVALVTALAGRCGVEEMARYTEVVRSAGREANPWWALATGLQGVAEVLMGNLESGKTLLEEALDDSSLAAHWSTLGHAYLALVALELGDQDRAVARVEDARSVAEENGLESLPSILLTWSVAAKVEALSGDSGRAAIHAERARKHLEVIGDFRAFDSRLQLLAPVCLAEAYLALSDVDAAREMWVRADAARAREPRAALAHRHLARLDAELTRLAVLLPPGQSPTAAESRVLELLPTHASLQEIADQLFVSRNTVKTHTLAVYRKLGVSSRGDAVLRARELHLLADRGRSEWTRHEMCTCSAAACGSTTYRWNEDDKLVVRPVEQEMMARIEDLRDPGENLRHPGRGDVCSPSCSAPSTLSTATSSRPSGHG